MSELQRPEYPTKLHYKRRMSNLQRQSLSTLRNTLLKRGGRVERLCLSTLRNYTTLKRRPV